VLGLLLVGGVVAGGAAEDGVLADVGEEDELFAVLAADGAGVSEDGEGGDAAAGEDAGVGFAGGLVAVVEGVPGGVEAVGVLHGELADADEAATWSRFVTELGLDLVDHERHVAVALDLALEEVDDDLLVGGAEDELAFAAVLELHEDVGHGFVAAGFAPELGGLEGGHDDLLAADAVHLLADDLLDLAHDAPAEREVGEDAGGELLDEAGAEHELEVGAVGLGGGVAEGLAEEMGKAHGELAALNFQLSAELGPVGAGDCIGWVRGGRSCRGC